MSTVTFEKRLEPTLAGGMTAVLAAIVLSLAASAVMLRFAGASPVSALAAIYEGAFGNRAAIVTTLLRASPLILTGVAVTVAFRAKIWNIGAEGQLYAGAMVGYGAYLAASGLPTFLLLPLVLLAGFAGGAGLGALAGYLRARFAVNEVLSTVMLNYVVRFVLSYLLVNNWRDATSFYQQSARIAPPAVLPSLVPGTKLHLGFLIALVAAVAIHVLLSRTAFGYEIKAVGQNPVASRFKGIDVGRTAIIVMLISGGLAGLAGVAEVFGTHLRLRPDISVGYGFAGIVVAMLAGLRPMVVVPVAILFAGLSTGGANMQIETGVPSALTLVVQAIVLIFFLITTALARYRIKIGG
ncbi:ABC transporter permease [Mesorhizobium sp. SP-1A]|uniref:ABC transporter permease n=1 Tax=Mesorhizobium sp. SP-1A TaxID=3077840 RepID=UPI0028F73B3B|nr:ABC transporter permease [Mesorhizobium sp. SP-1A]